MRLLTFWSAHANELLSLVERHLLLVGVSTLVAIAIGVPAGIAAARRPRGGRAILAVTNAAQTIPSLALLGFLLPLPFVGGVGSRVAIAALILYALLPIVRGTVAGLSSVDPSVVAAGVTMGMTARQLLWMVELPLALPAIVAGSLMVFTLSVGEFNLTWMLHTPLTRTLPVGLADSYASMRIEIGSAYTLVFFAVILPVLWGLQYLANVMQKRHGT